MGLSVTLGHIPYYNIGACGISAPCYLTCLSGLIIAMHTHSTALVSGVSMRYICLRFLVIQPKLVLAMLYHNYRYPTSRFLSTLRRFSINIKSYTLIQIHCFINCRLQPINGFESTRMIYYQCFGDMTLTRTE